jgi:hypothetical protein
MMITKSRFNTLQINRGVFKCTTQPRGEVKFRFTVLLIEGLNARCFDCEEEKISEGFPSANVVIIHDP